MLRIRRFALIALLGLLAAACGQRPGVFEPVAGPGGGSLTGGTGDASDLAAGDGSTFESVDGADGVSGAGSGSGNRGGSTTGGGTRGSSERGGPRQSSPDDGPVWGDEIVIGIHAPVTGAASLKSSAFEAGRELYWKYLAERGTKIHGRTVKVEFEDDTYSPSRAAQVCKAMTEGKKAFMLLGAAGTDQIVECARYASTKNVPYLSAGVTENVVAKLPNYFGISMSYPAQGPLLAKHLKTLESTDACRSRGATCDDTLRVGLIVSNTPNFDDAAQGFRKGFQETFGRDVDYYKVVGKNPSQQEATQQANELRRWNNARGIDVVYILSSVTFVQNLATGLDDAYRPRFVGVGITMVNQGVDLSCPKGQFDGAHYYNPFPAWAERNDFDPDFDKAVAEQGQQNQNVANGGDLMWSLWTVSRVVHQALEHAGKNLTQGGFIRAMESFKYQERKAYADLQFTPDNHFGAATAHLLEARCTPSNSQTRGQFHTLRPAWG